jgi:DNA-binding transcriptional MocR family regulator
MSHKPLWKPLLRDADGPTYLAIARAVENSIGKGELKVGDRLPPQRALAAILGVDFTTVSRGYAEAQRRGLLEAQVGRGTYVKAASSPAFVASDVSTVDMLINHPPFFQNATLEKKIRESLESSLSDRGMELLMRYQTPNGERRDRIAGAAWLAPRVPGLDPARVLVCPGVQGALLATTMMLARPGETVCVESLTYPGYLLLARELGIRVVPVQMDEHGALPESLDEVCRSEHPKAFYCTPSLHNPTSITMPVERREAIVEVARRNGLPIIEDDNYWPCLARTSRDKSLLSTAPSLASLAPELVYYVSGLSKCVSPALRIAYLIVPDAAAVERAAVVLRATATMAAPLTAAIATHWIETGLAEETVLAICAESDARQTIAVRLLGSHLYTRPTGGFHLWLPLQPPWTALAFSTQLRLSGIWVAGTDAFCVGNMPDGVRLCLGAPATRRDFEICMNRIAEIIHMRTYPPSHVV